jgi:hypothetical protein
MAIQNKMEREQLSSLSALYSPELWYANIYDEQGNLIFSKGCATQPLAKSFVDSVLELRDRQNAINETMGLDPLPKREIKIEKAIAWEVRGQRFNNFRKALEYYWKTNIGTIKGLF